MNEDQKKTMHALYRAMTDAVVNLTVEARMEQLEKIRAKRDRADAEKLRVEREQRDATKMFPETL